MRDHEILHADRSSNDELLLWQFLWETQTYEREGHMKFEVHIFVSGDNSWIVEFS
jgi:hypothetical protein